MSKYPWLTDDLYWGFEINNPAEMPMGYINTDRIIGCLSVMSGCSTTSLVSNYTVIGLYIEISSLTLKQHKIILMSILAQLSMLSTDQKNISLESTV